MMIANARLAIFADSCQDEAWTERNCENCRKAWDENNPETYPCQIQEAMLVAFWDDGTVSHEVAERCGYFEANGKYTWDCPELSVRRNA